ncbi:MAG: hypothetical protein M1820_009605 [Bogoriella megaspora]|nr:MAG: hypothetical protein M1820_009605 [Bogoriella megaspora]
MPPAVNRFGPNHMSNPFINYPPGHGIPQNSQIPHHNANLQQGLPGNPFTAGGHGGGNPFSLPTGNAGLQNAFSGGTGGLGGGQGMGLASIEARRAYQHGAQLQEQAAFTSTAAGAGIHKGTHSRIREVWKNNLESEMRMMSMLVFKGYNHISLHTEFPGVVARPMGNFPSKTDYHYQTIRINADLLKVIQLGITLWTPQGEEVPPSTIALNNPERGGFLQDNKLLPTTWQFNFEFDKDNDMYNEDSVEHLAKAGLDLARCRDQGIPASAFGAALVTSGMVGDPDISWISFHAAYDIAYLVKLMWCKALPDNEEDYSKIMRKYFPSLWDVKYLQRQAQAIVQKQQTSDRNAFSPQQPIPTPLSPQAQQIINSLGSKAGIDNLAEELGCTRNGVPHSAGSEAWLVGSVFWAIRTKIFDDNVPDNFVNQQWGLNNVPPPASSSTQAAVLAAQNQGTRQQQGQQHGGMNGGGMGVFHAAGTPAQQHRVDSGAPSTPTTGHPGLVGGQQQTTTPGPGQHGQGGFGGGMTPGGGGVFGNFTYGK